MIDLDAYFARIGYDGSRTPALETLSAIHALHPATIPFENLSPLQGMPVPLDLESLQRKMVTGRRGGYCFEQNTLFKAVLESLGFSVESLMARVMWRSAPDRPPGPRSHMLLKIDIGGEPYIADVGFGGYLLDAPLRLLAGIDRPTPMGVLRFVESDGMFTLQARISSGWKDIYRFTVEPHFPADYEVANWFTSTHPQSMFRNNLLMERLTPKMRLSLLNTRLTHRHADGRVEEIALAGPDALCTALDEQFGVEPPEEAASLFARLPPPE